MIRKHTISFKHAFDGVRWAFSTQPNYRIHLSLSLLSITAGLLFQISYAEWILIIFLIFLGLAIETMNSSVEKVCDAVTKEYNEHIKLSKDAAAGAMLLFATGAFIVACMIFIPKFIQLFS